MNPTRREYETESNRLVEALGKITETGIVEAIQHIGATSVPGLSGSPCVDIVDGGLAFSAGERSQVQTRGVGISDRGKLHRKSTATFSTRVGFIPFVSCR